MEAEVTPDRGGFGGCAQPVRVGCPAGLGGFGLACLGSLRARRPLMFSFALEFNGPDTARGREMSRLWQHEGFRRVFRIITAVWGVGFLLEAALRVIIIYNSSTGTALVSSKVTPFVFAAIFSAWTVAYGTLQRKRGERMAAASQLSGPSHVSPASSEGHEGDRPHMTRR
jgi:hypothetical protein